MQNVSSEEVLSELIQSSPAVLLLYGGASCGVCQSIKPRLEALAREEFPNLVTAYIDCQGAATPLCAARGIFSLPVVQLWFNEQKPGQIYFLMASRLVLQSAGVVSIEENRDRFIFQFPYCSWQASNCRRWP
ncbi:Thioredoxin [Marinobacter antarcticus]|uniref:Thioredoxin n=1 Tax=Marinobacter antarcticus TaxID=564117 RepID=A0A1M6R3H9_9GAMM|nr:thioredoxin family protein [Marinobacter antarcticus]SHK26897.1 Thioredoxin [Marinobacter antarcticus]